MRIKFLYQLYGINAAMKNIKETWEYDLTKNTIFLPVDQRYDEEDIRYIISVVESLI